jgi:hypothetical protein
LRIEGVFAKTHNWQLARRIVDSYDVKPARAFGNAELGKEVLRCATRRCCFPGLTLSSGKADISSRTVPVRTSTKGERFAVVAGHIDFPF